MLMVGIVALSQVGVQVVFVPCQVEEAEALQIDLRPPCSAIPLLGAWVAIATGGA